MKVVNNFSRKDKSYSITIYLLLKLKQKKIVKSYLQNEKTDKNWLWDHIVSNGIDVHKSRSNVKLTYSVKNNKENIEIKMLEME